MTAIEEGMNGHAVLVPVMSEQEARACVTRVRALLDGARSELLRLYEGQGWRALGYDSWRACAVAEFGQSERYLYLQLSAAQIERRIVSSDDCNILQNRPIPVTHLRPLASLPEDQQAEAYRRAGETAPNGQLTAAHIAAVVGQFKQQRPMAVHYSSATPEWYTPPTIVAAVVDFFDAIDLDPCAEEGEPKTVPAARHFTLADNGLSRPWSGRVYLNPPYGDGIGAWVAKLDGHYRAGDIEAGLALVPARTDTAWFDILTPYAICFIRGRLKFGGQKDSAPFPSALVYLGDEFGRYTRAVAHLGKVFTQHTGAGA